MKVSAAIVAAGAFAIVVATYLLSPVAVVIPVGVAVVAYGLLRESK